MPFCPHCRKETTTSKRDYGTGAGEAFGVRYHDVQMVEVTDCCESADFYQDTVFGTGEQRFCEDLQMRLSDKLNDADTLPLASLVLIEQMLTKVSLPQPEKQLPKVSR